MRILASLLLCWVVGIGVLRGNRAVWPRCGRQISTALIAVSLSAPVLAVFLYHRIVGEKHAVSRNFYGVSWMREELPADPVRHKHTMIHGRIIHGYQFQAAGRRRTPCSYYGCGSGVNLAITSHPRRAGKSGAKGLRLGVVGLGAGGLAALANAGDAIRFYEINPDVQALAEDPACFTYLADCPAETSVVLGDGRISLERELAEQPQRFDVLALDAFSGDAVPAHLLTREAFEIYLGHLRDAEGIIAVNISNRALDLKPVVLGLAEEFGLTAVFISSRADGEATLAADWMLLSRSSSLARRPAIAAASSQPVVTRRVGLWTDDYHNLFQLMR